MIILKKWKLVKTIKNADYNKPSKEIVHSMSDDEEKKRRELASNVQVIKGEVDERPGYVCT